MTSATYVLFFRDRDIPLVDVARVGRDPTCDVVISDDPKVSREHARFVVRGTLVTVEDLASANGLFVNGARAIGAVRVVAGDVVRIGDARISLRRVGLASATRGSTRPPSSSIQSSPTITWRQPQPDLVTEPYGVDRYHVRWLQIEDAVARCDWALADDLLTAQIARVRRDIDEGKEMSAVTQEKVCRYAIDMAIATLNGEWLNLVARLHTQVARPLPRAAAEVLPRLAYDVRGIDVLAFETYVNALRRVWNDLSDDELMRCEPVERALEIVQGRGSDGETRE